MSIYRRAAACIAIGVLAALAGCGTSKSPDFQQELFESGASPYARNFNASIGDACEAARRALLSQGYLTTLTRPDTVDGTKNFQPTSDSHVSVDFHVVCTPGEEANASSIVYVNAVQNGYALKKSDTSASVGLSILGSLSLPIRTNNDAMVKVSSQTIPSGKFYDRFFALVDHYLQTVVRTDPVVTGSVKEQPLPLTVDPAAQPVRAAAAAVSANVPATLAPTAVTPGATATAAATRAVTAGATAAAAASGSASAPHVASSVASASSGAVTTLSLPDVPPLLGPLAPSASERTATQVDAH